MHQPLKSLSLVTATLLLSLASPLQTAGTNLGASIAQVQAPTPPERRAVANVEGTWTITEAKTLDGRNYTGTVVIQPIGQIYDLSWQTSVGNQSGIAFLENGHLFVGWGTDEAAGYGVVVYKIGNNGTLNGRWTYSKQGGEIGTETATGGRPNQIEGDYQVTGTNPNEAGRYKGILNIRKTGNTYELTWSVGSSYRGVGIRSGDWLVVSYGQSGQFGVIDYAISGDKASGRSALLNQPSLSVENLVRTQASANLLPSCTPAQTPTTQSRKAEADCLLEQGIKQIDANRLQVALQPLQQALAIYREIQDRQGEGQTLKNLGNAYYRLKDYAKAIESQQQVLAIARELKERSTEAAALAYLGDAYASLNENPKAIEFAQQALPLARETKNSGAEAVALDTLTRAYSSLGDAQKTLEFAQQSLAVARQIKNNFFEWRTLVFLSEAHNSLGDSQKAVEFAQQSLALARETKNRDLESRSLIVTSSVYWSQKDYQKMIEFTQESLAIAREIKNRSLESMALSNLSAAYWALRDYQKGIEYDQQALAIHREIKDRSSELLVLHSLGANYIYLGDYQKAIELFQQELALAREIKNYDYEGSALAHLGFAYFAQGDSQKIIEYGQQALAIGREKKSSMAEFIGLLALSIGYGNLGNNEKALEFSQSGLAIAKDPKVRRQLFSNAEELVLNVMGSLYRKLGRKEQAIAAYRETLAIDNGYFTAQVGLARTYRELNMPITAITYYKQAISNVEQIRGKISGLDRQSQESFLQAITVDTDRTRNANIYRELADLLLSQGRILEAQQVLELLKVQELRDFTKDTRAGGKNPEVSLNQTEEQIKKENGTLIAFGQKIYECQQTRCNQLSQLLDQREALTEQFNQKVQTIEKDVRDRRAQDDAFLDPKKLGLKAKEIVEAQPGTVLIYPLVLDDKIWLLWASKGGIIKSVEVPKVGQKQLAETVLKFRQLLQLPSSNIAELQATGKQLYDWLIKPIESELKENKIKNLVFSLDRAARYIPMSALFVGHKLLHIATHGEFVPGSPDASYLLLGTGEKLAIPKIATLQDLGNVSLVVLSACETALAGLGQDGTEINGISYYFLNAGAKAVMASLWKVNDDSTRLLMQNFYGNLAKGTATAPITKAEALRQAQLSLLHGNSPTEASDDNRSLSIESRPGSPIASTNSATPGFSHPYYWAPFILIGNGL